MEAKTESGKLTIQNTGTATVGFQPTNLSIHSKCVLCDAEIVKEIPNGVRVDGFMPPYVCDSCKELWAKFKKG